MYVHFSINIVCTDLSSNILKFAYLHLRCLLKKELLRSVIVIYLSLSLDQSWNLILPIIVAKFVHPIGDCIYLGNNNCISWIFYDNDYNNKNTYRRKHLSHKHMDFWEILCKI